MAIATNKPVDATQMANLAASAMKPILDTPERSTHVMTDDEIAAALPASPPTTREAALAAARERMVATGQWTDSQFLGRRWPIGCVALEITQRCNLDCTACYLSDHSEAVKDIPIAELFRRIDMIHDHYGDHTDVQVTGGEPTLRERKELIAIVRRVRDKGMRPTLFTNGIRATRDLLSELVDAGLVDVAFHVDMTQQRQGYADEIALNALRRQYIDRARGLGLPVMFNTTVIDSNVDDVAAVTAFFVRNCDVVRLASFQLQADTGRGVLGTRDDRISIASIRKRIDLGAGTHLSFDTAHVGHERCNRYAMALVIDGAVLDALDDSETFRTMLARTTHLQFDRLDHRAVAGAIVRTLVTRPRLALLVAAWLGRKAWKRRRELLRAHGKVHKLSFFIHDFMDACHLERDRIDACVFTTATETGPISMCLHNAKRDAFILKPIKIYARGEQQFWNPLTGSTATSASEVAAVPVITRRKLAKGRLRRALMAADKGRRQASPET